MRSSKENCLLLLLFCLADLEPKTNQDCKNKMSSLPHCVVCCVCLAVTRQGLGRGQDKDRVDQEPSYPSPGVLQMLARQAASIDQDLVG